DSTARTFTASHLYLDDPPGPSNDYTVTATVTDNAGGVGSTSRTLTVTNVAPTVRILSGPNNSSTAIDLVSEVSDPSPLDTFTYVWTVTPTGGGTPITGTGPNIQFVSAPS